MFRAHIHNIYVISYIYLRLSCIIWWLAFSRSVALEIWPELPMTRDFIYKYFKSGQFLSVFFFALCSFRCVCSLAYDRFLSVLLNSTDKCCNRTLNLNKNAQRNECVIWISPQAQPSNHLMRKEERIILTFFHSYDDFIVLFVVKHKMYIIKIAPKRYHK